METISHAITAVAEIGVAWSIVLWIIMCLVTGNVG